MKITKIKDHIGAYVTDIDLREPVDAATRKQLNDAIIDNVVLVIRGQEFTAAQYQAAAELFGELMEDQNRRYLVDGLPLISVLSNRHKDSNGNQLADGAYSVSVSATGANGTAVPFQTSLIMKVDSVAFSSGGTISLTSGTNTFLMSKVLGIVA